MAKQAKATNVPPNTKPNPYRPNVWGMLQNIIIASINKGQFLIMVFFLVIIVLLIRMPTPELPRLAKEIFRTLDAWHILGWLLAILEAVAWFIISKRSRRAHSGEMNAVSNERSELQEELIGRQLKSSKRR